MLFPLLFISCAESHSQHLNSAITLEQSPNFAQPRLAEIQAAQAPVTHLSNHPLITELDQRVSVGRPEKGQPFEVVIPAASTPAPLLLRIDGPVSGLEILSESGEPRGDLHALAAYLTEGLEHDYDKALTLFEYAYSHFHNWLPAGDRLPLHGVSPHNLADNFWIFGYGFCEDISFFCAALWQAAGLEARVVGVGSRHSQAEVFFDGDWRLFDAQHRMFWRDKADNILSASKLKTNPSYFRQGLDEMGLDPIAYPPVVLEKWFQENDLRYFNPNERDWQTDLRIDLRAGEYFELRYVGKPVHYRNPLWLNMVGDFARDRRPPFGIAARQFYEPQRAGEAPALQQILLSDGRIADVITMQSPYVFTDAWVRVPQLEKAADVYVWTEDRFDFVGVPMLQGVDISPYVAGTKRFAVCFVLHDRENMEDAFLGLKIQADLQMADVGIPSLKQGLNRWPLKWETGAPLFWLWYREGSADLSVSHVTHEPEHPKVGEMTRIVYRVENNGSAMSQPTPAILTNPTTGLLMETLETVGQYTLPPIPPGEAVEIETWWLANTRMHWYGQNPYVQTLDFRIDPDRQVSDVTRDDHRVQHHIHMSLKSGRKAALPGYNKVGL